jgi:hypothetical protein
MTPPNPFAVLGLPEWPDLEDETVRAAWRAIAAQTHPDREDGGDLARYTQACAAFAELNTPWGRSEVYADLVEQAWAEGRFEDYPDADPGGAWPDDEPPPGPVPVVVALEPVPLREVLRMLAQIPARICRGHLLRLLIRAAVIAGLCLAVLALVPGRVAAHFGVVVLIVLFVVYARADMSPRPAGKRKEPERENK